jgi:hypothetical protein
VVREANGRLRNRVRVDNRIEVHAEGVYYIEWRKEGRRLREAIRNPAAVLERAQLKSLELEAVRAGASFNRVRMPGPNRPSSPPDRVLDGNGMVVSELPRTNAEQLLLAGIEAYIKERMETALRAHRSPVGVTHDEVAVVSQRQPQLLAPSTS